ncbi:MAG: DUF302 domain-containing protein [Gammaproteobacteria bacterium]
MAGVLLVLFCLTARASGLGVYEQRARKSFADAVFDAEFAITERNFRITSRNAIGTALRERGHAGTPDIEIIHFCSLERAREILALDPAFVNLMPCRLTLRQDRDEVVIGVILLPERHRDRRVRDFARRMNALLREIARDAARSAGPAAARPAAPP